MWNTNTMHSFFEVIQPNNACKINNDRSSQSPQTGKDANRRGMTHRFRSFTLNSKPECNQYDGENALRAKKKQKNHETHYHSATPHDPGAILRC